MVLAILCHHICNVYKTRYRKTMLHAEKRVRDILKNRIVYVKDKERFTLTKS